MGEAARQDETIIRAGDARVAPDDGSARGLALLVLAVTIVALAAGLLLESGPEPAPEPIEQTAQA